MPQTQRTWTVDSIEEGIAAVEEQDGRMIRVPAWLLPDGVREGDVVALDRRGDGEAVTLTLRLDRGATERALARSREQVERLRSRDPGGDIVL